MLAQTTNWNETLDEVERSIGDCLAVLDRYELAFAKAFQEQPIPASRPVPDASPELDEMLAAATRRADEVEQLLVEQEVVWNRWRQAFGDWQRTMRELPPEFTTRPSLFATATT